MSAWRTWGSVRPIAVIGILIGVLALAAGPAQAVLDSKGTDFWLAFPGNAGGQTLTLFIAGTPGTTGTVAVPGLAFSTPFVVPPVGLTSVIIPAEAELNLSDTVENRGVHVTADQEVTVYGLSRAPATTDAYLGLPTDVLGSEHIILAYGGFGSEFGIVATLTDTTVTITPSVTTGARLAGVPYVVALDQGQTYLLQNTGGNGDLTGTLVNSNKPVAVFAGHRCANVPPGVSYCDHIVEQLPPTSTWGTKFLTMPLATRLNGDTVRVVASSGDTNVSVNGVVVALGPGEVHEEILSAPAEITANKPILVAQYSNGSTFDNQQNYGDPFMLLIPPFEQFLAQYTVSTPDNPDNPSPQFPINFINVVAPTAAVEGIKLDGTPIANLPSCDVPPDPLLDLLVTPCVIGGGFAPIGSSTFSGAQVGVGLGPHGLTSNPSPFGVFVYGFGHNDSYGYLGGQSFAPVALVTNVVLTPESATNLVGTEHCVTATVTDQNNQPLKDIRVDFAVTGDNPTAGFANTHANGQAEFCYTGTNAGDDTITASVGNLSDTATKTWRDCTDEGPCLIVGGSADEDYMVVIPPGTPPRLSQGTKVHVKTGNLKTIEMTKTAQVLVLGPCRQSLASSNKVTVVQMIDALTGNVLTTQQAKQLKASFRKLKQLSTLKKQALLAAANSSGEFDLKVFSLNPDTRTIAEQHGCRGVQLKSSFRMVGLDSLGTRVITVDGDGVREWLFQ